MNIFKPLIGVTLLTVSATALEAKPIPASTYLVKAGASDLFERQSGQLMLASNNAQVRKFAQMMVTDHTKSTAEVKRAALSARLHPSPPSLSRMQARDLAALRRARGADRDRLYIEQQKVAHRDALMLQQGYAADGSVRPLKMAASGIVPVVKHHIGMLERM